MTEQEQLAKSRRFYGKLLAIGLFAFALLHSIDPFFFRFFFWISLGMGAMTLYYHIALKNLQRGNPAERGRWNSPQQDASNKSKVGKIIGIVIAIVFFIFFLLLLIGIFVADDVPANGESQEPTVQDTTAVR